jgi:hypothetical protein
VLVSVDMPYPGNGRTMISDKKSLINLQTLSIFEWDGPLTSKLANGT